MDVKLKEVTEFMSISKELNALKEFQCNDRCVLSVYLNTNPADPDQLKGAWKIHLKSGLKRMEEYITASKNEDELKAFKKVKDKVVKEIDDHSNELRKGVVQAGQAYIPPASVSQTGQVHFGW